MSGPVSTAMSDRVPSAVAVMGHLSRHANSQPGQLSLAIPSQDRRNEYQPKGGDALRLGSKGRYGFCVSGR